MSFLNNLVLELQAGDRIRVQGRWITLNDKPTTLYDWKYEGEKVDEISLNRIVGGENYSVEVRRAR